MLWSRAWLVVGGLSYLLAHRPPIHACAPNAHAYATAQIERVERVNLDPIIFNWYVCLGVFLSSWLVCPALPAIGAPFAFSAYSFFAGTIFVFAVLFSFLAIPLVGIAIGQGVWGSSALLVSFLWGAIPGSKVYSPIVDAGATAAAVALLLCGALGIVYCKDIAVRMCGVGGEPCQTDQGHVLLKDHDEENPMATQQPGEEQSGSAAKRLLGIGSALLVGVFGGAILVPTKYDPDALNYQGGLPTGWTSPAFARFVPSIGRWCWSGPWSNSFALHSFVVFYTTATFGGV